MELWKKIDEYTAGNNIDGSVSASPAVICAFSGGADSSVLLRYLKYRLEGTDIMLAAAHMDHMIRGEESCSDANFCRRTAEELDIPFYIRRADIPAIAAERGVGLEECARAERYAFLEELSEKLGGAAVATAHSATDNLETLIFNICRGCGTKGVTGIDPVRGIFIRPLLCCTSEEIRSFAKENGIDFVIDSTNADTSYTRNYIRGTIVPAMKKVNIRAEQSALRLSRAARDDCGYIEKQASELLCGRREISRNAACGADNALFARLISLMWKNAVGKTSDLSAVNIADCRRLLESGGCGRIDLGAGYSFFACKDTVFIDTSDASDTDEPAETELNMNGATEFGAYVITVAPSDENIYNLSTETSLDFDKIYGKLYVRCRRAGDTVLCRKMHKKLKKLMCDKNVPRLQRDRLPIICDEKGILLVPGVAVRDGAAAGRNKDTHTLRIAVSKKSD